MIERAARLRIAGRPRLCQHLFDDEDPRPPFRRDQLNRLHEMGRPFFRGQDDRAPAEFHHLSQALYRVMRIEWKIGAPGLEHAEDHGEQVDAALIEQCDNRICLHAFGIKARATRLARSFSSA